MQCPFCSKPKSRVLESRPDNGTVWRQRMCAMCFKVWTTKEQPAAEPFPWSKVNSKARARRRP